MKRRLSILLSALSRFSCIAMIALAPCANASSPPMLAVTVKFISPIRFTIDFSPSWLLAIPLLIIALTLPALAWRRRKAYVHFILTAMSLITIAVWVRSYWYEDSVGWDRGASTSFSMMSNKGRVGLWVRRVEGSPTGSSAYYQVLCSPGHLDFREAGYDGQYCHFLGFALDIIKAAPPAPHWQGRTVRGWNVAVPYWALTLAAAVIPLRSYLLARRRNRRLRLGLCPTCAYDLRASKDKCPECGTPIPNNN